MGVPLYMTLCFFLVAFRILALSLTFAIVIVICLGVGLFGFILFGSSSVPLVPGYLFPSSGLGSFQP